MKRGGGRWPPPLGDELDPAAFEGHEERSRRETAAKPNESVVGDREEAAKEEAKQLYLREIDRILL